jgi:hypothetical protein
MKIIDKEITIQELQKMAQETFGNMVKAVVDVKREIVGDKSLSGTLRR